MSTVFMYMFSYVNVFSVPVPQPSSVSVYLRVRVKSTVYVNPRLLVPGSPVHRDRYSPKWHYTLKNKGASRCHRRTPLSKWVLNL